MTAQLPPQDPQGPDEHLPGEAELAALYRQLPQSEPSAALDAAVLHAAAQAVATNEQPIIERRRSSREPGDWVHPKPVSAVGPNQADSSTASRGRRKAGSRWLIALSSAATLVLAAGVAWHMRGMPSSTPTPDAASHRAAVNSPVEVASPAAVAAPPPPAAPGQLVTAQAADHLAEPVATLQQTPRMASAKTTTMKRHHATPSPPVEEVSETAAAAPPPVTEMTRAAQPVAQDYSSTTPVATANQAARNEVAAAPMPMPAPPAPALPPPVEMSASAVAPAPFPAAPAPAMRAIEKPTAINPGDTPVQELGKIQQLFAQGHDDEARQRLTVFHHAHPQWQLPAELNAQLHKP